MGGQDCCARSGSGALPPAACLSCAVASDAAFWPLEPACDASWITPNPAPCRMEQRLLAPLAVEWEARCTTSAERAVPALMRHDRCSLDAVLATHTAAELAAVRHPLPLYHAAALAEWPDSIAALAAAGLPSTAADTLVEVEGGSTLCGLMGRTSCRDMYPCSVWAPGGYYSAVGMAAALGHVQVRVGASWLLFAALLAMHTVRAEQLLLRTSCRQVQWRRCTLTHYTRSALPLFWFAVHRLPAGHRRQRHRRPLVPLSACHARSFVPHAERHPPAAVAAGCSWRPDDAGRGGCLCAPLCVCEPRCIQLLLQQLVAQRASLAGIGTQRLHAMASAAVHWECSEFFELVPPPFAAGYLPAAAASDRPAVLLALLCRLGRPLDCPASTQQLALTTALTAKQFPSVVALLAAGVRPTASHVSQAICGCQPSTLRSLLAVEPPLPSGTIDLRSPDFVAQLPSFLHQALQMSAVAVSPMG